MKLSEIARLVNGDLHGQDIEINGVSDLDQQFSGTVAYAEKKQFLETLLKSPVAAVIINRDLACEGKPFIRVDNPKLAFSLVLEKFSPYQPYPVKIYPNTFVESSARLGNNVTVMPFAVIMDNSRIGDGTVIYPHVFIGKNVKIGKNCLIKSGVKIDDLTEIGDNVIIHHNSVIGGDGFGYIQQDGRNLKIPQIGKIVIKDNVEIGACVTIDRSTISETVINKEVKIDNLSQIAHNVKIGEGSIVVSQVGIAGSSTVGKNCFLAGQVGISDHVEIGDNVAILAQSGVDRKHIDDNSVLLGYPARDVMLTRRIFAAEEKLPELIKTVREIQKKVNEDEK